MTTTLSLRNPAILMTATGVIISIVLLLVIWNRDSMPAARYTLTSKWTANLGGPIATLSVSHLGQFVAVGCEELTIYDASTGRVKRQWPIAAHIVAFNSDDTALIVCDNISGTIAKIQLASTSVAAPMTLTSARAKTIVVRDGDQDGAYLLDVSGKIWYVNFSHNSQTLLLDSMSALDIRRSDSFETSVDHFAVRHDGTVLFFFKNLLFGFDVENGELTWKTEIGEKIMPGLVLRDDGNVAIVARSGDIDRRRQANFEFALVDSSKGSVVSSVWIDNYDVLVGRSSGFLFEFPTSVVMQSARVAISDIDGRTQRSVPIGHDGAECKACSDDGSILATFHLSNDLYVFQVDLKSPSARSDPAR